jgi:small GTP-binding protein
MSIPTYVYKIIILGDSNTGKSSLIRRFTLGTWLPAYKPTIGIDFRIGNLDNFKFHIWDTAGQERFRAIIQNYYRGVDAIILCFSCDDKQSFYNLSSWIDDINHKCPDKPFIILVGNKCEQESLISKREIEDFCVENDISYLLCSSKANIGIREIFEQIRDHCYKQSRDIGITIDTNESSRVAKVSKQKCQCIIS